MWRKPSMSIQRVEIFDQKSKSFRLEYLDFIKWIYVRLSFLERLSFSPLLLGMTDFSFILRCNCLLSDCRLSLVIWSFLIKGLISIWWSYISNCLSRIVIISPWDGLGASAEIIFPPGSMRINCGILFTK